ncbi:DUF2484 family protein [Aliiroseovarius crassostreae]|uniref:DUF2484 family protein n=1 Tax=Aliiroseovarius crassostreae TaxID=154981 RepID=UPI00220A40C9|nr:DUF2484 family protein [Aliiroseovarius crassostreae]UWQ06169.1 DUF2484 family protein [Aliiroseovarius crassostreae]
MSLPLILACLWVVIATLVAFLPMRAQFAPGAVLLLAAPALIVWIGATHGWLWTVPATFAILSLFRRPLSYLLRKVVTKS